MRPAAPADAAGLLADRAGQRMARPARRALDRWPGWRPDRRLTYRLDAGCRRYRTRNQTRNQERQSGRPAVRPACLRRGASGGAIRAAGRLPVHCLRGCLLAHRGLAVGFVAPFRAFGQSLPSGSRARRSALSVRSPRESCSFARALTADAESALPASWRVAWFTASPCALAASGAPRSAFPVTEFPVTATPVAP